jgi:hypothetical protein
VPLSFEMSLRIQTVFLFATVSTLVAWICESTCSTYPWKVVCIHQLSRFNCLITAAHGILQYVCNAFAKIAQVVAEARLLAPGVKERPKKRDFLLETRSPEEVDEELQAWVQEFLAGKRQPLVMSIAIDSAGDLMTSPRGNAPVSCRMNPGGSATGARYRVLERWILRYDQGPHQRAGEIAAYNVAKQLFLLVRSVHSCLRMLPCHKTVSKVTSFRMLS